HVPPGGVAVALVAKGDLAAAIVKTASEERLGPAAESMEVVVGGEADTRTGVPGGPRRQVLEGQRARLTTQGAAILGKDDRVAAVDWHSLPAEPRLPR